MIIITINNKKLEPSKVTGNENEIGKLNGVWNDYNKTIK